MIDSPFIEAKIQYAWDSTSLGWFKTCPRLYQYHMLEGWRRKSDNVHLAFGSWYHSALERYDRLRTDGLEHDDALRDVIWNVLNWTWERDEDGERPWQSTHPTKNRENLVRSVVWYIEHFIRDPAETYVLANGKPAVELSFRMELDYSPNGVRPYVLCGHMDRLVKFTGGLYVMDRKTTGSTIGFGYYDQFDPDNQMSLYTTAARIVYKTPVQGVIVEAAQIAAGFTRFARGFTYRTDAQVKEWMEETKHWLALARDYAIKGYWPRNDKSCHHYGGCAFRKVCSKSPEVREKFLESDYVREPWNPLAER